MALSKQRKIEIERDFNEWYCKADIYNAPEDKLIEYIDNCLYGSDSDEVSEWIWTIIE